MRLGKPQPLNSFTTTSIFTFIFRIVNFQRISRPLSFFVWLLSSFKKWPGHSGKNLRYIFTSLGTCIKMSSSDILREFYSIFLFYNSIFSKVVLITCDNYLNILSCAFKKLINPTSNFIKWIFISDIIY